MQENFIKIISATYKLLDVFPQEDPLKHKAKERMLLIAEKLTIMPTSATLPDDIAILESYLELAQGQGWIQGINFLILKKEWGFIKKQVSGFKPPLPSVSVISAPQPRPKNVMPEQCSFRQEKILAILSKKEKAQVQDIIKEMPKVTKRTIRRDLDDLLKRGRVKRTGEFNRVFYQNIDRTHLVS